MRKMRKGQIFVISAPSGAGKTSLVKHALTHVEDLRVSVSYTTRQPRPSEIRDKSYHYISKELFEEKIHQGDFAEYAEVYGEWYGTDWQQLANIRSQGYDVILEIDCQGARIVKDKIPEAHLVFILPPSMEELKRRLNKRNEDSEAVIEGRLAKASNEIQQCISFDYIVFNDEFADASEDLASIIRSHRLKMDALDEEQRIKLEKMIHL